MRKKIKKGEMTFLEHVEVLRWHLIRSIVAIFIFAVAAFIFRDIIFDFVILAPKRADFPTNRLLCALGNKIGTDVLCINSQSFQIINIKLAGQLMTHITVSFIAGFLIAFPWVFYEFWKFIKPALHIKEKKHSRGAVFFTSILFTTGSLFGYFVITPLSVHFLGTYEVSAEVSNQINLNSYIQTFTSVILAAGLIFELPMLIFFLSKIGLVTPKFLKKYRKHAFVIVLVLSAIITPPDIFSQLLVSGPLVILYELGIIISKRIQNRELAEENLDLRKTE